MRRKSGLLDVGLFTLLLLLSPLVWTSAAQAACGIGVAPGTTHNVRVSASGRSMLVHVPKDYDGTTPPPLLFVLHGSNGTGAGILKNSKLEATADQNGFILAAPDGGIPVETGFVWNIPGVPTVTGKVPGPDDADDVAYIKEAISWLAAQGCVDTSQVYATGLSGGGRMTSWLGCVAADTFAAIAPVVGLRAGNPLPTNPDRPDPATCTPTAPMPVMAFAGDKDTVNPIQGGGTGYWQYTMHAAEQRWAQLNGCTGAPTTRWVASVVYEERYSQCQGDADVVARITVGGKHEWVADNEAMWAFLSQHRR